MELYGDEGNDGVVNVSEVLRRGFLMNWTASDCSACDESGGCCGFDESSFHFRCFCTDRTHSRSCPSGGVTIAALTSTCIIEMIFIRRKQALLGLLGFQNTRPGNEKDIALFLKKNGNLAPMRYKYSDIKKMTKTFSENLGKEDDQDI